jgi:hypothetical protein
MTRERYEQIRDMLLALRDSGGLPRRWSARLATALTGVPREEMDEALDEMATVYHIIPATVYTWLDDEDGDEP